MLFNSLQFLIFFFIVTAAYFALPHRFRWPLLLVASCYFYMVLVPEYILILFFLILVDYSAGLILAATEGNVRKFVLILSLVANIGVLGTFKYFDFFNDNLYALFHQFGWHYDIGDLRLILPIGLSFHTFQSMSYTIEVYRGNYKAERHLGVYALYVLFYPQMVAGPIERPGNLLRQFHEEKSFDYQRIADGMKLMTWGLFKKIVIADRLAILVNHVYDNPTQYRGWPLILATYFFSFQIYCDFSGYSDMAIGAAKVMGIRLMKNFDVPYHAKSIGEFWRRWHISLSSWFRDYLYISLGGNRVPKFRWYFNIIVVFLVSGLWHGANWTFLIWGGLHGFYLIFSAATESIRSRLALFFRMGDYPVLHKVLKIFVTFHLVTFAWIFFRAKSVSQAWYIVSNLFQITLPQSIWSLGLDKSEMAVAGGAVLLLELVHLLQRKEPITHRLGRQRFWFRWACYGGAAAVILLLGKFTSQDFIYFQF